MNLKNIPKLPGIYKLTNKINGKIYIGKSVNLYNRIKQHRSYKKQLLNKQYIHKAIIKYGTENFDVEILHYYDVCSNNSELIALETAFIDEYKSLNKFGGYNIHLISSYENRCKSKEKTKRKISKSLIGNKRNLNHKHTKESKNQISKSLIKTLSSSVVRNKMKSRNYSYLFKSINQINKITGEIIKTWNSIKDITKELHFNQTSISHACSGRYQSSYGFIWKFV